MPAGKADRHILLWLVRLFATHKAMLAMCILCMVIAGASEPLLPWLLGVLIDGSADSGAPVWLVQWLPIIFVLIGLLRAATVFGSSYLGQWLGVSIANDLRCRMAERLLHWPAATMKSISRGEIIYKIFDVPASMCGEAVTVATTIVQDGCKVTFYVLLLLYIDWVMTAFIVVIFPVLVFLLLRINSKVRAKSHGVIDASSVAVENVSELLRMWPVIRSCSGESYEQRKQEHLFSRLRSLQLRRHAVSVAGQPLVMVIFSLPVALMIYYYSGELQAGNITAGGLTTYVSALLLLQIAIRRLSKNINLLPVIIVGARTYIDVMNIPVETYAGVPEGTALPVAGGIKLSQMSFTYPGAAAPVLKDINLDISPGEKIALVGPSGAGKSTLAALVMGLFSGYEGKVLLFGREVRDWPLPELRQRFAVITQTPLLFNDTVAQNISYPDPPDKDKVEQALAAVGMPDFVQRLPHGLDTVVGNDRLSGGQQQLLSLARAFYRKAPVVVFDEATSNLDGSSEQAVKAGAKNLLAGRTAIIIAHRFATIDIVDRIAVMAAGRIVDFGTSNELLARCDLFRELWQAQQLD